MIWRMATRNSSSEIGQVVAIVTSTGTGTSDFTFAPHRTGPKVHVPDDPKSDEFAARYKELARRVSLPSPGRKLPRPTRTAGLWANTFARAPSSGSNKLPKAGRGPCHNREVGGLGTTPNP